MIPVPSGPGDLIPSPEASRPILGREPVPLVLQAMEEIGGLKRSLAETVKRLEALEGRIAALESRMK